MKDSACIAFLQWALPQLHMRWPGFRKVYGQVHSRLNHRLRELQLDDLDAYREYLARHTDEWPVLDQMCRITISRFYRDKRVFRMIGEVVLPMLAESTMTRGEDEIRCWSAGCAAGEEAYSLALVWHWFVSAQYPGIELKIIATDTDPHMLQRAQSACYPWSSVKALPEAWRDQSFDRQANEFCLQPRYRDNIFYMQQDIRQIMPEATFHMIFCRNLAFTYFEPPLQHKILADLARHLGPGGVLLIGVHETLPDEGRGFERRFPRLPIFRKSNSEKLNDT